MSGVPCAQGARHSVTQDTRSSRHDRMWGLVRTPGQRQESVTLEKSGKSHFFGKPSRDFKLQLSAFIASPAHSQLVSA